MTIVRRTKIERENMDSDHALLAQIAAADLIELVDRRTRGKQVLWKRSEDPTEKRRRVVTFEIDGDSEFRDYSEFVKRIKCGEAPG
jgi:hypothetical protein